MYHCDTNGQMTMLETGAPEKDAESQKRRPQKQDSELVSIPYFYLDLKSKHVDLFGNCVPHIVIISDLSTPESRPESRSERRCPIYWRWPPL